MKTTPGTNSERSQIAATTQLYVVGFLFDSLFTKVALIRKQKPEWQAGLLNGIGGKIERGESPIMAMGREFSEEADYDGECFAWKPFGVLQGQDFVVHCFYGVGDPGAARTREAEVIEKHNVCDIAGGWEATVGNIPWLVAVARDCGMNRRPPRVVTVQY